ncbi:MAG: SoxR reducing system RseC family protein [Deferribacterota bacterium]|nr:SoxR reducing system RseC family protein [Deferribacterota bacterium]
MSKKLTHRAKIIEIINEEKALIEIDNYNICKNCPSKSMCNPLDENSNIKIIDINKNFDLQPGDIIEVETSSNKLFKSTFLIYMLPIVIVLITALFMKKFQINDLLTAISTIFVLILYFFILHIIYKKTPQFKYLQIRKLTNNNKN